jgi:hypothetical protein
MKFVTPAEQATMNVLLYAGPKAGKTMAAASAPGPILYLNADMPNATRMAHTRRPGQLREAQFEGLVTLEESRQLIGGHNTYKTVVLDTAGEAYRIMLEGFSHKAIRPSLPLYGDASVHLERWCRDMCAAPVNFVVVCHEIEERDEATGEITRMPFTGTSNTKLGSRLMSIVDVIGYCGVVETTEGLQWQAQLTYGKGRKGGDRFGVLGTHRDTNLTEWLELINQSNVSLKEAAA